MGCCGKARANLGISRAAAAANTAVQGSARTVSSYPLATGTAPLRLRYIGTPGVVVRGPATGKPYTFTTAEPTHVIDPKDAAVLLRTQYFRPA
jgi:hypothetical protein